VEQCAKERISLDDEVARVWQSFPDGVERRTTKYYRLGDYFDSIELIHSQSEILSLKLIFYPKEGVSTYWKALLMGVLRSISKGLNGASVTSIAQT